MKNKKIYRKELKERYICIRCIKPLDVYSIVEGYFTCSTCLDSERIRQREKIKETRRLRKLEGKCKFWAACGNDIAVNRSALCEDCAIKLRKNHTRYRHNNRERCILRQRKRNNRIIEKGFCITCLKNKHLPGISLCQDCREDRNRTSKMRYEKLKRDGLCITCMQKVDGKGYRCSVCINKHKEDYIKKNYTN